MPAAVQTKSRQNRAKLFKTHYWHSTPNFRCYHGSRLPPRATFQGMFPHSKFLSKDIKCGRPVVEKKKVPRILSKRLKAEPKKRKKRGILKRTETGKKKMVIKDVKRKKRVSIAKKGAVYKRREQEAVEYRTPDIVNNPALLRQQKARQYGRKRKTYGSTGDPKQMFRVDAQGRLVQVAKPRRKILI